MSTQTELRTIKKLYKSALCAPCSFHIPILKDKLIKRTEAITPATTLEQYRVEQLINKLKTL
jgi:hypothetical protein